MVIIVASTLRSASFLYILFFDFIHETALILTLECASHIVALSFSLVIFLPGLGQKLLSLLFRVPSWRCLTAWMLLLTGLLLNCGSLGILRPLYARFKEVLIETICRWTALIEDRSVS